MDREPPTRRRARAIAISRTLETERKALFAKLLIALATMAIVFETLNVTQHWVLGSHP